MLPQEMRSMLHLAELASLVGGLRPLYAIGYIATLQKESGLDASYPLPTFPPGGGGRNAYDLQRDEVARGINDARARRKPSLLVTNKTNVTEEGRV